jgi:hypothetical protein
MLSKYRLPNQEPGEKVIKIIRRDLFILVKKIAFFLLLSIAPLAFFYLVIINNPEVLTGELSWPLIILGASAYYLFIWLFFFFSFVDYYLDVWIVTNRRIIDMEQNGLFSRTVSEQKLEKMQDVTSEVRGFFPTIFAYGNVYIQTAGEKERFHFRQIPNPDAVRDLLIKLEEENEENEKKEIKK